MSAGAELDRRALRNFVAKVDHLEQGKFVKTIRALGKMAAHVEYDHETGFATSFEGPDQDEIDAVTLSVRFFLQDKDGISPRVLSKQINESSVPQHFKDDFARVRSNLNTFLDSKIQLKIDESHPTYLEVIKAFIYGELAHQDAEQQGIIESWKSLEAVWVIMTLHFAQALNVFIEYLRRLARIVEQIQAELDRSKIVWIRCGDLTGRLPQRGEPKNRCHMPVSEAYERIFAIVRRIPRGRVATYGQIATFAGLGGHARQVGYALNAMPDDPTIPWHRVINSKGEISTRAEPGATSEQRKLLEAEGIIFDERGRAPLKKYRWQPRP